MSEQELLSTRYGIRPKTHAKRGKYLAMVGVALLTLAAGYFGLANYSPVQYQDLGYRVVSDYRIEIDFQLTKPADATVVCSLEALNNQFAQVGWAEFEFPAAQTSTQLHTVTLNTTELAVTGLVDECRLR